MLALAWYLLHALIEDKNPSTNSYKDRCHNRGSRKSYPYPSSPSQHAAQLFPERRLYCGVRNNVTTFRYQNSCKVCIHFRIKEYLVNEDCYADKRMVTKIINYTKYHSEYLNVADFFYVLYFARLAYWSSFRGTNGIGMNTVLRDVTLRLTWACRCCNL